MVQAMYDHLAIAHPTTVRGVAYALFTKGVIDSMSIANTGKVSKHLVRAREEGVIPWSWVVDDYRQLERAASWNNPTEFVATVRKAYRRDFWDMQSVSVEVWCEKATMRGVIQGTLDDYGVGFRVMKGFGSATALYGVAQDDADGKPLKVLYIGDFDPSGMYMSEQDLPSRLDSYGGVHITVDRIALTREDTIGLPSFSLDSKRKDPRAPWFRRHYGTSCWEIDAMDPNLLRERVESEILSLIDRSAWNRCVIAQEAEQESLKCVLDAWKAA